MAIRNILKSTAQSIVGKQLKKVAGGFSSLIGGPNSTDSSDFGGINRSKTATNMLSFPLDVANEDPATGGNHGHYIMFFINEQENAKLKFDNTTSNLTSLLGADNLLKEAKKRGFGFVEKQVNSVTGKIFEKKTDPSSAYISFFQKEDGSLTAAAQKINVAVNPKLKTGDINKNATGTKESYDQTISVERAPTKRLDTVITMFMPAGVAVKYAAEYNDQTIGTGTAAASQITGEYLNTGDVSIDTIMNSVGDLKTSVGRNALLQILSMAPVFEGSKEAIEIGLGTAFTDRMELAFKGVRKREFSYSFKMMPRSEEEANEVKRIIDTFKFHMLPEMTGTTSRGRMMNYPSSFDIKYMYQNRENNYLNKITECYLTNMDVSYGGDRYRTFEGTGAGAPPTEVTMALSFKEIELVTREKAVEGY